MEDFTQELVEVLKEMTGPDIRVILTEVTKVNDQTSKAINLIRLKLNVHRLFYPKEFYEEYCRGRSITEIAEEILEMFQNDALRAELELKAGILDPCDFDKVKNQLYCRLVNFDKSQKYLENKCYLKWLDFAVCFYILVESKDDRHTITDVTTDLYNAWNVSENELLETAFKNLCNHYPAKLVELDSVIEKYADSAENPADFAEYMNPPESAVAKSMYILTNTMHSNSAIAICYPNVLKHFTESQKVDEVIILPSSIHESILIPIQEGQKLDAEHCNQTIREINATKVLPEEVLSDHAYIYCRISTQIKIFR